jgi:uncharacterized protein YecE (DUF72 family)
MLFHLTMTHNAQTCPAYDPEQARAVLPALEKLEATAQELGLRLRFVLWGAPEHVAYALVEGENLGAIVRWVNSLPIRQEFRVTPVVQVQDLVAATRAMLGQQA